MSTFLGLCQDLVKELGVNGGIGPGTVTGQVGELANIVRWVRDANDWVNSEHHDWRYLWTQEELTLTAGQNSPSAPVNAVSRYSRTGEYDRFVWWLDYGEQEAQGLKYKAWTSFSQLFSGQQQVQRPQYFTVLPNETVRFDSLADREYTVTCEYWRRPAVLADDSDQPEIPSQYHRIILARAGIMYANREDAPELVSGFETEYASYLTRLEADQLSGQRSDRMSETDDPFQIDMP